MQYIADRVPDAGLAPAAGSLERYPLMSWLSFITSEIHKEFTPLFKPNMPTEAKTLAKDQLAARFSYVDQHLCKRAFLLGKAFSVADAYLFVTTGLASFVGINWHPGHRSAHSANALAVAQRYRLLCRRKDGRSKPVRSCTD